MPINNINSKEIASVSLEYYPMNNTNKKIDYFNLSNQFIRFDTLDLTYKKLIAVAAFAGTLRKSEFMNQYEYDQVYQLAVTACDPNNKLDTELLQLIQKANKIYNPINRKKPRKTKN